MLISPEMFYDMYIKGKDEQDIQKVIRGLKNKIGTLKNGIENPYNKPQEKVYPSDDAIIDWSRKYLNKAFFELAMMGVKYKLSTNELKAKQFNDNILYIEKITFYIGGFFGQSSTRIISFDKEQVKISVYDLLDNKPIYNITHTKTKTEFINSLSNLNIGEWRKNYDTKRFGYHVLDGTQWDLTVEYNNSIKPFNSGGSNSFPYNFTSFEKLILCDENDEDKGDDDIE